MTFIPWSLYEQILDNMPIACVDVAILHDGKVLLVKRLDEPAKGQYWLPGGRVLKGEMLRDAAIRKTRDEFFFYFKETCVFNSFFLDGSVKFIKDTINRSTWWALGTKSNGEVISADSY